MDTLVVRDIEKHTDVQNQYACSFLVQMPGKHCLAVLRSVAGLTI